MNRDKLNDYLEELKEEIEKLEIIDPSAADRLKTLAGNIENSLDSRDETAENEDLYEGVQSNLEHFEMEHPAVTGILNRIATLLSDMGI